MKVEVINVYSNEGSDDKKLKGDHGQSFYIKIDETTILIDTGTSAKILLQNMHELGLSPDTIDKIFLTHGHYDHMAGLYALLGHFRIIERKFPINIYFPKGCKEVQQIIIAFQESYDDFSFKTSSLNDTVPQV